MTRAQKRTLQHVLVAFVGSFLPTLLGSLSTLNGSVDAKLLLSLVVGAAGSAAVVTFRKFVPVTN